MVHSNILAGTVALFALAGVNAGPCHPSLSITTTAVSTSIAATETLPLSLSAIETASATEAAESESTTSIVTETETTTTETAETASSTEITESESTAAITDIEITTTESATSTEAESTAAATTTSVAQEEPEPKCNGLSSPYMAAGSISYDLLCGQVGSGAQPVANPDFYVSSYQECLDACSMFPSCWGVNFHHTQSTCTMWSQVNGFYDDPEYSTSKRLFF